MSEVKNASVYVYSVKEDQMSKDRINFLIENFHDQLALGKSIEDAARKLRAIASDEEIDQAVNHVKSKLSAQNESKKVKSILDSVDFETWYQGPSELSDSHWQLLTDVLRNKKSRPWNSDMIANLDHASSMVVSYLSPPKSQTPKTSKGLVLGYVQSGKTANFSAVISKSVDAGYKLVVVLAGMHNILRKQTQARLHEEIVRPKERACTTLTSVDENGDFQKRQKVAANRALSVDGFTLVVLKKNASVLRNFNSWLDEALPETLKNCPTLVIDDESDQASVNTNRPEDDPTAINDHIRKLVKKFSVVSYIGYTATPFANVLIDSSLEDDLYPKDFIVTLDKPSGYIGGDELFGRDAVEPLGALEGLPVIRTIPNDEATRFKATKKKTGIDTEADPITASMAEAIDAYILGCSARLSRGQWNQHMTMLIHISHLVAKHSALKEAIEDLVLSLKLDRKDESSELKERLLNLWKKDFLPVSTSPRFKAATVPDFEVLWRNSAKFIERLEVVMENHASEERLTYDRPDPFWGIAIGGNTLSRGLTLEGLNTSYFVRGSKGYDTLLQMGRWFGYRPDYVDLTRIYVTEDLQSKFYHLATVEQEIRDEIRGMAANKERPIDVGLRIRAHPSMTVTSNLKMRTAKTSFLTYSASKVQALFMNLDDSKILQNNRDVTISLLDKIEKFSGKAETPGYENHSACLLYRNVAPELILQFLEQFHFSSANLRFTPKMLTEYIQELTNAGELSKWSVAVMSPKSGISYSLGGARSVYKVDRSIMKLAKSEIDPNAKHVKVITAPGDELVDLRDIIPGKPPARYTDEVLASSSDFTEASLRQIVRPKDRGLLLLYVINPNLEMTDAKQEELIRAPTQTIPLKAVADAIGVAFVFPKTENSKSAHRYVVNGTV